MRAKDIRSAFLDFFEGHGHTVVPSGSLIPHNDPTLFFVNAGMVPFKDTFTGKEVRDYTRATTVQKCLRVSGKHNDLENVGRTPRHHTFFEMLGNFSFGDYFKPQAIPMAWDLLTNRLGIDGDRLWVTVFEDDDEAYELWKSIGFPEARLQRLGAKDNFWSMGETGPCGPCSEIHYDHGAHLDPAGGGPATESDRYVEIWNLVFMQYEQTGEGRFDLPRPSIDTGAGLERVAAVLQGVFSNYDTDLFVPLLDKAAELAGTPLGKDPEIDTALRVISDHARASAFLIGDGVMPSNEGRGYVLRRVMRRAIRFGVKAGINDSFLYEVTNRVIDEFGETYPELAERRTFIEEVVRGEEERFRRTLDRGMRLLDGELDKAGDGGTVPGDVAFTLADTFGFPLDLTQLIADERGIQVDEAGFKASLEAQRARGRAAWKGSGEEAVGELWAQLASEHGQTNFTGYDKDVDVGTIVGLIRQTMGESGELDSEVTERLVEGERGIVLLDRTPFYAESGGQVGDSGTLGASKVLDTSKASGLHLHQVVVGEALNIGDTVEARVDGDRRDQTRRNHTATHLLHAALRNILGEHVTQKGSLVGPDRLRFDFAHHKSMTADDVRAVEDQVNAEILRNPGLNTQLKSLDQAIEDGAMALFGEKYDADVRVVTVPGYSTELCGGTHVRASGDIGLFRITSESGIAAGVRRIEAQTGTGAIEVVREQAQALSAAAGLLKTSPDRIVESIEKLQKERKELEREIAKMKSAAAKDAAGDLLGQAREFGGVKVLAVEYSGDLREQADRLRDQLGSALIVLLANRGKKVQILAAATKDVAGSKIHAGKVLGEIAPLVGGRGGGRPDMAQGGGSDPAGIPAALAKAWEVAEAALS